jgi:hypothetical protein
MTLLRVTSKCTAEPRLHSFLNAAVRNRECEEAFIGGNVATLFYESERCGKDRASTLPQVECARVLCSLYIVYEVFDVRRALQP